MWWALSPSVGSALLFAVAWESTEVASGFLELGDPVPSLGWAVLAPGGLVGMTLFVALGVTWGCGLGSVECALSSWGLFLLTLVGAAYGLAPLVIVQCTG